MSSIIPNKSHLEGKIVAIRKSDDIDNFSILEINPSEITHVEGSINLVNSHHGKGDTIWNEGNLLVHVSDDVALHHSLAAGKVISVQVRKSPDNLFVIPDSVKVLKL